MSAAREKTKEKKSKRQERKVAGRRSLRRRLGRGLLLLVLLLIGSLAITWGWLESSWGEAWARRQLETRGSAALQRELRIGGLEWDLAPPDVRLTDIEIAGAEDADENLLRAAAARIRVDPWALLGGRLRLRAVDVDSPVVHWDTGQGPSLALEAGSDSRLALSVDSLTIENGAVEVNHRRWNLDNSLTDVSLQLQPVAGEEDEPARRAGYLRIGGGGLQIEDPTAEAPARTLELASAEIPFALNERRLQIDDARLVLGDSVITADGSVDDWSDIVLAVGGEIDVRDLLALSGRTVSDSDAGTLALTGTVTAGNDPLRFAGSLSSASISLAGVELSGLDADIAGGSERVVLDDARVELFGGSVTGRLEIELAADPDRWLLTYDARDIDLNALSRSPALPGFRFAGIATSSGELRWQGPFRDSVSGSGSIDLSVPAGTLMRLAEEPTVDPPAEADPTAPADEPAAGTPPETDPTEVAMTEEPVAGTGVTPQRVAPSLPLPLAARAAFELEAGALRLRDATASLPGTEATFDATLGADGAIDARVRVDSRDLRMLDRFFNQLRRYRGEQPVPRPLGVVGAGSVTATIGGTLESPTLSGRMQASSLAVSGNPIGDVEGNLRLAGPDLRITDLVVRRGGGSGGGAGRFRIGEKPAGGLDYDFDVTLDGYPISVELPRLVVPLSAAGPISGTIRTRGDYNGAPVGDIVLTSAGLRINGFDDVRADVDLQLEPDEWLVHRFELAGPRARLTASGTWRPGDESVQARVDAVDLDAARLGDVGGRELPVAGTLNGSATLSGAFADPDADMTLTWTDAAAYGTSLGSVAASAELRDGVIAVVAVGRPDPLAPTVAPATPQAISGDVAVPLPTAPPGGWAASLSAALEEPRLATLRASGRSELALALAAAQGYEVVEGLAVDGTVDIAGSGVVGEWIDWQGTAELRNFTVARADLSFSVPQTLRFELDERLLTVELPELVSEAGSLQAGGVIDLETGQWRRASSTGMLSLAVLGALTGVETAGSIEVDLRASGEVLAGDVTGGIELSGASVRAEAWPWAVENLSGTVRLAENRLELVGVEGTIGGRPLAASGTLPLAAIGGDESSAPVDLEVSVDGLPLDPLWDRTGALSQVLTGGQASLTATVTGRGTDWRTYDGRIRIRALRVDLTDLRLEAAQPATLIIDGPRLELADAIVLQGPGTDLEISGAFLFDPFRLDTRLRGTAALDPLNVITQGWGVAGRSEIDVRITGNPPELSYDGTMTVTSGLLNPPVLQPIENISAELTLQNRLVRIDSLSGSLGNRFGDDPNVIADGEIQLVGSVPQRFDLNLSLQEALLRLQRDVRVTASGDLVLAGTIDRSILSGTLNIAEGEYTADWQEDAGIPSVGGTAAGAGVDSPLARSIVLDLDVIAPGELRIVNNLADVELSADLQVRGTMAEPVILGNTTVLDGTVVYLDQRYRFLRGSIEFQNPLRTEPSFDVALETSIRQYLVTVNASGSPARGDVTANIVSSPPLSTLQLIQLLTSGDAPDESGDEPNVTLGALGAQATSFLTRQYLRQVERGAQQVFGIDRFNVEPAIVSGSGDPAARITIGKQVTSELVVTYTTVIGSTDEQLVSIEYQLTRGIRLTATREEDGALGIDIRFDHRFR